METSKMEIKLLPKSLRETLRSEVNIRSIAKCIAQLVFNSLDAKSASIAIRINLVTFKLQIIDNGTGISKRNLKLVGFRHATSKYYSIEELEKNPNIFPSRGESLASIIKLSQTVKITTRCSDSQKTFCKVFENGKSSSISSTKHRPSKGTTIIIENFMYNLPVRRKTINQNTCLEEIKNEIEFIALIHPNTSFSLRNDSTGEIIFHTYRTKYVYQTAAILYGKEFSRRLQKICYNDRNFSVSGLISLESHGQNKIQLVYVNRRFVPKTKIHTLVNTLISKSKIIKNKDTKLDSPVLKQKHAAFIINIKCPYSELDILDYIEPEIEFKDWDTVLTFVENALIQFLKKKDLIEVKESKKNYLQSGSPLKESLPNVRTSQVDGVIRGIPMKRKFPNSESISTNKSNTNIVTVDVQPPPKILCTEIVPSSNQTPETNALETISESGKKIIMDMFLKSTTAFRTDDDLKEEDLYTFKSADKYTNRSSSCLISTLKNNCNTTSVTTSTKISIKKTVEHNSNNNFETINTVFKVPHTSKLLKNKSTRSGSTDWVSKILARDRMAENKKEQTIPKDFYLDFLKNVSKRNNIPSDITNHFSKLFNNFTQKPKRNNNYECTIKIKKRLKYTQFSDFLKPATKLLKVKNVPHTKQFRYENYGALPKKSKEIVHGNSMLKTFFDVKNKNNYHIINNKYKNHNFVPKINHNHNYLTYKNNYHNIEPLSSTFENESLNEYLPIYNIKRNSYHGHNYNKDKYYKPKYTNERINNRNHVYFPSPELSFKPFSSNPNLSHLFSKNSFTFGKPDLYFNYNYPSPEEIHEKESRNGISIPQTFQSHEFAKDCCKDKQNTKPKICANKKQNYFDLTNKQFETQCNKKSNIISLPEVPETPVDSNTFLNCLQSRNNPENNTSIYYESNNISSWMENSKKLIHSAFTANSKINSPCIITNNDSHEITKNCCKDKQNIKPKTCANETQNYFDFTNKQFETQCNKKSNIISLPEVPTTPVDTNTFLNCLQSRNNPENNTSKYYESNNISKKLIQSAFTANSPCIITNNDSHEITKNCCKEKQNIKPKTYAKKTQNYFDFTNKQFETECNKKSNITPLPEVSETPLDTNTFLNCLQNRNSPENNTSNYDSSNISSWMKNSKKLIQSSFTANRETNTSSIITNNANKLNNIDNNTSIEKNVTANISFVTPNLFSDDSIEIVNVDKKKKVSIVSSKYSSPIISHLSNRKGNINKSTLKSQQNGLNNKRFEKNSIVASSFSSTSNLIQEKDISNILSALNQSIINDTLNSEKRNCNENDKNGPLYTHDLRLESEKELNISGTNLVFPVFKEDSSNLILENTKNIDEILNISVCNDKSSNLNIIQQENNSEMCNKNYETTNNVPSNSLSKKAKESEENINQIDNGNQKSEWMKQTSEVGNHYYLNLRTGMTSFGTPKNIDGCLVTKRHAFMPKGMSPIMFNTSTAVSKELSPKSKSVLHQTIANTENDELETVKWMNFLGNKDSEKFFNDLYSSNKNYETEIPNLNQYSLPKKIIRGFENYSFSKDDFNNVTVINQCDNKFIVTKIGIQGKYDLLVLFDQHAVHERIRLEKLLKDYEEKENKLKSIKCRNAVRLLLNDSEIRMLQNYKSNFENWGIFYEIQDKENVIVTRIPLCWQTKDDSNLKHKEYSIIESLLMSLIQEESNWLRNVRKINVALPLAIQNTIKTEACRSAIKFGDQLSKEQCENLINDLLLCDLPFNCAHGRPTIFPIIDLNNINNEDEDEEINLNILKT